MESRILKIDLSNRSYEVDVIPRSIITNYIGGRGLGAYLLYTLLNPTIDPLGEENHLIFTSGPANGTNLPFSSKSVLNTKSPLTNVYLYSVSSGTFSHQIRKAGYWAIDIKGIANTPTYIEIDDRGLNFKDANSLWGVESNESQRVMRGSLPKSKAATIAIGPAGEKLIN